MRQHVEREVKLVPGEGFKLPALGRELPRRVFVSTYHDTSDLRLARHGVTFRYRTEDGTGVWQLKLPRGDARLELEQAGPPARPPEALLALLAAYLRGDALVRVARLRTRRQSMHADGAEIVDDSVAVLDGQRVVSRFRELEVELQDGDGEALHRMEKALREAGAESGESRPKLYRALDLAYPPTLAERSPGATPLNALRAALAVQYTRLLAHDPGTRLGIDPEDLHQMRVATRRARAFLRAARPLVRSKWVDGLRDELGWLGSALGPARDLDVLLAHVSAEVGALGVDGRSLQPLVESLKAEHATAREAAVAALSEERYFALLDRLEQSEPRPASTATETLTDLWWAEFKRTRRTFHRLDAEAGDDALHAARIRVKRARYAAELAAHELGKPGERVVDAAKRLQDILGEHQDAFVAEDRIAAWANDEADGKTIVAPLLERQRDRRLQARVEWPDAWKRLAKRAREARP
ncbi:MAG: CYTH and CHAD domain-containing protein [Actinobacteria bacterium]|nr:CYTH and CHAD domain-containing protein [Actinomycetota bacterium]